MSSRDPGPIPNRWLNCPRKATGLVADKFLAFKTPLGNRFNNKVPDENRFTPSMLFTYTKSRKLKLGMWIDLTNTSRFYDKKEIEDNGCEYVKMQCRGHGETPSLEQTRYFISTVSKFLSQRPLEIIGIHCTHGFNRTGFLLVSYMVEQLDCSVEAAVNEFAKIRPPGIYKQDYLQELYHRYDDEKFTPAAPPRPDWCNEEEEEADDDNNEPCNSNSLQKANTSSQRRKGKRETTHKKDSFLPEVNNVEPFNTQPRLSEIQKKAQDYCMSDRTGFPGSQPVSMDVKNLWKLNEKPYRVSWKADGVRYMMLIDDKDEIYMIDRDNCVFKVFGLTFPHRKDHSRHLKDTLLDGEMVVDKEDKGDVVRYLIYDIVKYEGQDVGRTVFYPTRLYCIDNEIIKPRHEAIMQGKLSMEDEPFRIRQKQFWQLSMTRNLLGDKFASQLLHEPDGLIFQPSKEPYVAGRCDDVLKWKPSYMNSVDFRLKIVTEEGVGLLPKKIGCLYVNKETTPFAVMKVSKDIRNLNNKIIECKYENNQWVFMRERTDKSFPNSRTTAVAVCDSIQKPVTQDKLLEFIERHSFKDDSEMMPPPPKRVKRDVVK